MKPTIKSAAQSLAALPFAAAILFSFTPAANADYHATILSNNPAAFYEMQEAPGAGTAIDSSSNGLFSGGIQYDVGFNGTNDYPVLGVPGIDTNAYLFHAYSDSNAQTHVSDIDVSYSPTLDPQGPFTAECWARPTSDANNYDAVMGSVSGSYPQPGWVIYQTPGTPGFWALDCQNAGVFSVPASAVKNQWTHLVAVYDGANFTFYVNGVPGAPASGAGFTASTADFYIGGEPIAANGNFEGYITEVAIYTNALTAAQILNDYKAGTNSFATNGEPAQVLEDAGAVNTDPASITVNNGATATFDPIVVGSTPLSYQWYSNNVALAGATGSVLSFTASAADNGATYHVVVTNNYGSSTSQVATLTVVSTLVINSDPMSITRNVGSYAAFHVTASGTSPLAYQWSVSTDGGSTFNPILDATQETLWLPDVQLAQSGNEYSVRVSGPDVSPSNTPPATLTVQTRPVNVPLTGYGAVVAADKPVAFWQLNEPNGSSTAIDAVGSFNGTYTFAVTNSVTDDSSILFGVPGGVPNDTNTAVGLVSTTPGIGSGSGGTIQIPWAPELNPDIPWSVETWVQPESLGNNGGDYRLVLSSAYNEGDGAGPVSGWYIYQQPSDTFAFVPQPLNAFVTAGSIAAGNWYYLVITDDGTNFNFYINGVLATAPYPSSGFVANGDGINADGTVELGGLGNAMFAIGQRSDGAFNTFQGNVEDTAVYNYALTPKQITTHFLNQVGLTITKSGGNVIINWPGAGTLQKSATVNGTYSNVVGATSPYTNSISGATTFYRVLRQ